MRIISIKHVTSKSRKDPQSGAELGKKPLVLVQTAGQDYFIPFGQWKNKASINLASYVGGDIEVVFFAKGDKLTNGSECTADNTVIQDFVASMNTTVSAKVEVELVREQAQEQDEKAAFIRRMRKLQQAKAEVKTEEVVTTTTEPVVEEEVVATVEPGAEVEE